MIVHIELDSDASTDDDPDWDWTLSIMRCGLQLWIQDDLSLRPRGHDIAGSPTQATCPECLRADPTTTERERALHHA